MLTPKWSQVLPLALGAAVALGSATGAHAQFSKNSQGTSKNQPQTTTPNNNGNNNNQDGGRDRGFWSDPSVQLNRLRQQVSNLPDSSPGRGGRGGRGGRDNGGDGLAEMFELLERSPALQEEIKLKPDQKEKLSRIDDQSRQQQRELFRSLRNQGGNNNGGRGGRGGFNPAMFQQMRQARDVIRQQSEMAAVKVLTKDQLKRLKQIRLQIIGPLAVAEPPVAQALMLTDDQYQQVQQIVRQMSDQRRQRMETRMQEFRSQFGGDRGGPGGPGGPPQGTANRTTSQRSPGQAQTKEQAKAQPANANADDGDQDDNDRRGRRFDPDSPEGRAMQERMKESMSEEDKARKEAESAIGRVLASAQRARFNKMLGPIMDLTKLVQNSDRGGRGDRGGRD